MTRVVVLQSNYLPWKGYFDLINDADVFVYYDEVKYTKNDWRNRNQIYTRDGLQWLTIPIGKTAVRGKISAAEIPDSDWQQKHFKQLYHGYRRSPHFGQLEPLLQEVYLEQSWKRLIEINRYLIARIASMMGIRTRFLDSCDFTLSGERVERLLHLLVEVGATVYITGPSARHYLTGSEHLFAEQGIQLIYKDYTGYPEYPQLRKPFVHQVSAVDLIANLEMEEIRHYVYGFRQAGSCRGS